MEHASMEIVALGFKIGDPPAFNVLINPIQV